MCSTTTQGTLLQAGLQDVLLLFVVVTAAARDEQDLERLGRARRMSDGRKEGQQQDGQETECRGHDERWG
jgi:hypothetical protein